MREIIMEIEILFDKMNDTNKEIEEEFGNEDIPFAKVLYAMTKSVTKQKLFDMTDEELIKHIQRIQMIESR